MSACPIELTFLGTASQAPSLSRNTSCVAVRFTGTGAIWLFDCGEATQVRRCAPVLAAFAEFFRMSYISIKF
jgi:hypothetical protein